MVCCAAGSYDEDEECHDLQSGMFFHDYNLLLMLTSARLLEKVHLAKDPLGDVRTNAETQ